MVTSTIVCDTWYIIYAGCNTILLFCLCVWILYLYHQLASFRNIQLYHQCRNYHKSSHSLNAPYTLVEPKKYKRSKRASSRSTVINERNMTNNSFEELTSLNTNQMFNGIRDDNENSGQFGELQYDEPRLPAGNYEEERNLVSHSYEEIFDRNLNKYERPNYDYGSAEIRINDGNRAWRLMNVKKQNNYRIRKNKTKKLGNTRNKNVNIINEDNMNLHACGRLRINSYPHSDGEIG